MIAELASRTLAVSNVVHREHWKTKSYAAHVALGAFYENVITAIDAIVECYQGVSLAPIGPFEVKTSPVKDILEYLIEESDWIDANREELSQGNAHIGNLIDNLSAVYSKCIFLLGLK